MLKPNDLFKKTAKDQLRSHVEDAVRITNMEEYRSDQTPDLEVSRKLKRIFIDPHVHLLDRPQEQLGVELAVNAQAQANGSELAENLK